MAGRDHWAKKRVMTVEDNSTGRLWVTQSSLCGVSVNAARTLQVQVAAINACATVYCTLCAVYCMCAYTVFKSKTGRGL